MKKPPLERATGAAKALAARAAKILGGKLARGGAGEPFGLIEDRGSGLDALGEPNAAPRAAAGAAGAAAKRPRLDLRAAASAILRDKAALAALSLAALLVVALAFTLVVVALPSPAPPAARGPTREGVAFAERLIVPPRSSLAPRLVMEREDVPPYTMADAVELGVPWEAVDLEAIAARNDAAMAELLRTAR